MSDRSQQGEERATTARFVPPPGYTSIPNVLLDEVMPVASDAEWKVTCAIARQTFGWGREERLLSNAQICDLTGLSRQSVTKGIERGEERGFIGRRHVGSNKFVYGLRVKKVDSPPDSEGGELPRISTESILDSRKPTSKGKETPTGSKRKQRRSGELFVAAADSDVDKVIVECFEAWRIGTGKNGSSQLTERRAGQIRSRLQEAGRGAPDGAEREEALAFARNELLEAAKGMATSKWHLDNGHTNFDQLFRNRERIETFVERLQRTAQEAPDAKERFAIYDQQVENG